MLQVVGALDLFVERHARGADQPRIARYLLGMLTRQDYSMADVTADLLTALWDTRDDVVYRSHCALKLSSDYRAAWARWYKNWQRRVPVV